MKVIKLACYHRMVTQCNYNFLIIPRGCEASSGLADKSRRSLYQEKHRRRSQLAESTRLSKKP